MIAGATDVEGGAAAQRHFALCRVGDVLLAVSVEAVREALPVPAAFAVLPWRIDGLVGGVNRRGTVIPVIDPVRFLGIDATTPAPDAVVLVIECDERVLGLRVDVLVGMERVDAELVHSLAPLAPATGRAPLCVEAYGRPSGSDVVNVLDVRSLFRDTGLPLASEIRANNAHARSVVAGRGRPCLTFQCGELRFAIDAMLVHSVITEPALQPCRMPTAVWRHDVEHRGVRLAVLDLVRLAGLDAARTAQAPQVLVLRLPSGLVGLLADRIVDIVRIDTVDVRPIPALVVPRIELFSGVVEQDDGTRTLLMDSAGLAMDPGVAGMSRLNIATTPAGAASGPDRGSAQATETYLRYSVGTDVVTPFGQIAEILPLPAVVVPVHAGLQGVTGMFTHRGRAIPLIALDARLGQPAPAPGEGCTLVVECGDRGYGFIVHGLRAIERGREAVDDGDADVRLRDEQGRMVIVDPGPRQRFYRGLDLCRIAQEVEREVGPAAGRLPVDDDAPPIDLTEAA